MEKTNNSSGNLAIRVEGIGSEAERIPYTKFDLMKPAQLNNNVSLTFYQIDYSAWANAVTESSRKTPDATNERVFHAASGLVFSVAKLVTDLDGFRALHHEVNALHTQLVSKGILK